MSIERVADVLRYSRAKGTDKVVLIGIANHDGDGGAWPSIETLSGYANVDRRSVQRAISNLVEMGELEVVQQAGGTSSTRADRRTNLYRVLVAPPQNGVTSTPPRDTHGTERGDIHDANGVTSVTSRGDAHAALTVLEPSTEPSTTSTPDPLSLLIPVDIETEMFNVFWDVYPRHEGKQAARKAWDKAIKAANPVEIVNGALRYREDPNREQAFTAHASTWLNGHRWEDDPLPTRPGSQPSGTALYLATAHGFPGYDQIAIES